MLKYLGYFYGITLAVAAKWLVHSGHPYQSLVFAGVSVFVLGSLLKAEVFK